MTLPLADYSVLEAPRPDAPTIHRLALALAGKIAADLGAHVIKIVPPGGDPLHGVPALPWEQNIPPKAVRGFLDNAKSITELDANAFSDTAERERLVRDASVVLTDEVTASRHKAVDGQIICLLSSFPSGSPLNDTPVSEITMLALSGLLDLVGEPTREPLMLGGHQAGYAGGLALFAAMMTGLAAREAHGAGDTYDVDIHDVLSWVNWKGVGGSQFQPGSETTREGADAEWRIVKARDGWIALVFNQRDWPSLAKMVGAPALLDPDFASRSGRAARRADYMSFIEAWCLERTREEIYREAQSLRIPIGPVVGPSELLSDPQIQTRKTIVDIKGANGDLLRSPVLPVLWNGATMAPEHRSKVSELSATNSKNTKGLADREEGVGSALENWLVLDLGIITAGSATSALLADAGAEVLKIESASRPDPFRAWTHDGAGGDEPTSPVFDFTNRNKRGVGLDLKHPEGRDLFLKMVSKADVVVENFRRGVLQKLRISYEELKSVNPRIVVASVSSQGETGPDRTYSSYGSTLEATSGLAALTGYQDGSPVITGRNFNYPDQIVSIFAMGMIVSAVLAARRTGQGAHLDISQREVAMFLIGDAVTAALADSARGPLDQIRRGNADPGGRPQFCALSADGDWVAVTLPDLGSELAVSKIVRTEATNPTIGQALTSWLKTQSTEQAVAVLRQAGAAAAPALKGSEVLIAAEKGAGHALAKDPAGRLVKGFPFQSRRHPFSIHCEAPTIGQDTEDVLRVRFGIAKEEIATLLRRNVIVV